MRIANLGREAYFDNALIPEFPWTQRFFSYSKGPGPDPGPDPTIHQTSRLTQFPAEIGLYVALEEQMKRLISNIEEVISDFLEQSSTKSMTLKWASSRKFHKEGVSYFTRFRELVRQN